MLKFPHFRLGFIIVVTFLIVVLHISFYNTNQTKNTL